MSAYGIGRAFLEKRHRGALDVDFKPGNTLEERERRNRFRPADVAFFSSESDKNVALNSPQNTVFQHTFQYTHVSSAGV